MTPQEKANDLFSNFRYALSHKDAPLGMYKDNIAIQCALMAVDEIIKYQDSLIGMLDTNDGTNPMFWENVKQEIGEL